MAAGQAVDVVAEGDVPGVMPVPRSRGMYSLGSLKMDVCSVSISSPPQPSTGHAREPCPSAGISIPCLALVTAPWGGTDDV